MPRFAFALTAVVLAATWGCGRQPDAGSGQSSAPPAGTPAAQTSANLVDRARVEACAGFTAEKAAGILGVEAASLEVQTNWSKQMDGQWCNYWSRESRIGPGLQFLLEMEPTVEAAAKRMASLRRDVPAADASVREVAGEEKPGKTLITFAGVGDEAMWDPLSTGVTLRVANVIASIQASPGSRLAEQTEEDRINLERRVATELAQGLRTP